MTSQYQDDLRLLKKAKRRIHAVLILSYLVICLWPAGMYFLLSQPIFTRPDFFTVLYLLVTLVQMVVWMVIFFAVSGGKPWTRSLVLVGTLCEIAFCGWLIYDLTIHTRFIWVYIAWIVLEMVKNFYLLWLYKWLRTSWWAKIYYDHVITLSESERREQERQEQERQAAKRQRQAAQKQKARQQQSPPVYDGYDSRYQGYPQANPAYGNGQQQGYSPNNPMPNGYGPGYSSQASQGYGQGYLGYPNNQPSQLYGTNPSDPYNQYPAYPPQPANNIPPTGRPLNYDPNTGQYYDAYTGQVVLLSGNNQYSKPDFQPGTSINQNYHPDLPQTNFGASPDITSRNQVPDQRQSASSSNGRKAGQQAPVRVAVKSPVDIEGNSHEEAANRRAQEKENRRQLSSKYPRTAIRMAIVVYGELILFPLIVHLFQNNFVSIDNTSVFALNLMFTLCILTAAIWTLPIFYLYLKQPGCKKILWFCLAAQIGVIAFGGYMLKGYYDSDTMPYSMKVFTLFLMLEVIRYGLLVVGIFPAFKLPEIKDTHSASDEDLDADDYANYEFELVDEQDPNEEDDYASSEYDDDQDRRNPKRILSIFTHKKGEDDEEGYDEDEDDDNGYGQNQNHSYNNPAYSDPNQYDPNADDDEYNEDEDDEPSVFSKFFHRKDAH